MHPRALTSDGTLLGQGNLFHVAAANEVRFFVC
jgi:hypothetical protein